MKGKSYERNLFAVRIIIAGRDSGWRLSDDDASRPVKRHGSEQSSDGAAAERGCFDSREAARVTGKGARLDQIV